MAFWNIRRTFRINSKKTWDITQVYVTPLTGFLKRSNEEIEKGTCALTIKWTKVTQINSTNNNNLKNTNNCAIYKSASGHAACWQAIQSARARVERWSTNSQRKWTETTKEASLFQLITITPTLRIERAWSKNHNEKFQCSAYIALYLLISLLRQLSQV